MSAPRFVSPLFTWPGPDGAPTPNGKLYFFVGDSDTDATTYKDADLTQPHQNPVKADGSGVWPAIFLDPGVIYKAKLTDQNDAEIWTQYPIVGSGVFYELAFEFLSGTPPASRETMGMHTFVAAVQFPANFVGSYGFCLVNPAAAFSAQIADADGNAIGTLNVDVAGGFTFTTTAGAAVRAAIGDTWIIAAPAVADVTLADLSWTLLGVLAQ